MPWNYTLEGEGRMSAAASGSTVTISGTTYNVDGTLNTMTFQNGDVDTYTYDTNTSRMKTFTFKVGTTPKTLTGTLMWSPNGTLDQLVIADQFNASNSQTCNYAYDDLSRLQTSNCGTPWSQSFSYDQYGNMLQKAGNGPFQAFYNNATNRFTSISGEGTPNYDANGNLLNTEGHTYTWDPMWGNPSSGRMVEQQNGTTKTQVMYGPTGKVALMNGQTEIQSFQPFPGGGVFVHRPGSLTNYWRYPNWLGTSTLATTLPGRTKFYDGAYAPFGEDYSGSGTKDLDFTGETQDSITTVGGLYDFLFREYAPRQGRWISPDPAGFLAASLTNPQRWNRYAYVINSPLDRIDPLGLTDCLDLNGNVVPCNNPNGPSSSEPDGSGGTGDYNDAIGSGGPGNGSGCSQTMGLQVNYFALCPIGGGRQGGRYGFLTEPRFRWALEHSKPNPPDPCKTSACFTTPTPKAPDVVRAPEPPPVKPDSAQPGALECVTTPGDSLEAMGAPNSNQPGADPDFPSQIYANGNRGTKELNPEADAEGAGLAVVFDYVLSAGSCLLNVIFR